MCSLEKQCWVESTQVQNAQAGKCYIRISPFNTQQMQSNHYYDDACWLFLYFAIITSDILDALRILAQYIHFGMSLYTGFVQINN